MGRVSFRQAGMAGPKAQTKESAEAAECFAAYVAMGVTRSLRKLAAELVRHNQYKTETKALNSIARWSSQHRWQERIEQAATERSERMLREAAELDADTFLRTSRHLHRQVNDFSSYPDTVIKIRESVRKPMPKGGAVNVSIRVEIQSIVDRIAEEDGLSDSEKQELADAIERHLAATPT